jgi:hypothetical protein
LSGTTKVPAALSKPDLIAWQELEGQQPDALVDKSYLLAERIIPQLMADLERSGWDTNRALLGADEWRVMGTAKKES